MHLLTTEEKEKGLAPLIPSVLAGHLHDYHHGYQAADMGIDLKAVVLK
jgi:hypothetical protein